MQLKEMPPPKDQAAHPAPRRDQQAGLATDGKQAVWSCNEWDPLEEIIVGCAANARYPAPDRSSQNTEFAGVAPEKIPSGAFPDWVLQETQEDLDALTAALRERGIVVRHPQAWPHDQQIATPFWQTQGFYNYCPRDVFLVLGDLIVESPNAMRGRLLETFSYRELMLDYFDNGARWLSAPRPMLQDAIFDVPASRPVPRNAEPIFDAANILRLGEDLLYLISSTGNERGAQWLSSILPPNYRVHPVEIDYYGSHIDTSIVALRPGLLLCNPERVKPGMLPKFLQDWEIIFCPEPPEQVERAAGYTSKCLGSRWMGLNLLSLSPDLVIADKHQTGLIELLDRYGISVVPLELRHARMLGGGFHCVTLDIRRKANGFDLLQAD